LETNFHGRRLVSPALVMAAFLFCFQTGTPSPLEKPLSFAQTVGVPLVRSISHVLAAFFNNARDFKRRWNQPAPPPSAANDLQGHWEGEWISQASGHRGPLRCVLSKTSPGDYQAAFHAVYCGALRVAYTVPLHGRIDGGKLSLEGETDIGRLAGGIYSYKGEADETAFRCTYRCRYDHGTFQMRPAVSNKQPPRPPSSV
jgi:hypothetical protein